MKRRDKDGPRSSDGGVCEELALEGNVLWIAKVDKRLGLFTF